MLEQIQINKADLLELLRTDYEAFINFMIPEQLTYPVPAFHIQVFANMVSEEIVQYVCAMPRDHSKTTLAKLAVCYKLLFSHRRFALYVSNTFTVAAAALSDIYSMLSQDKVTDLFGEFDWVTVQSAHGFYKVKMCGKLVIMKALGVAGQVRGTNIDHRRPDLIIADDVEDAKEISSEQGYQTLKNWWYGTFKFCFNNSDYLLRQIGNLVANISLLNDHLSSAKWVSTRYGAITSEGKPLWEDRWSLERLKEDYTEYEARGMLPLWFAEMMNIPTSSGNSVIDKDEITQINEVLPHQAKFGFITIDPAISKNTWAHKSAIAVHIYIEHKVEDIVIYGGDDIDLLENKDLGYWVIAEYKDYVGATPDSLHEDAVMLAIKWGISIIGFENIAYQAALGSMFKTLDSYKGYTGFKWVPIPTGKQSKTQRIASWAGLLRQAIYRLLYKHSKLIDQLLNYNPSTDNNDDDVIDACSMGNIMLQLYAKEITTMLLVRGNLSPPKRLQIINLPF